MLLERCMKFYLLNSFRQFPCISPSAYFAYQFKLQPNTYYPDRREEIQKTPNKIQMQYTLNRINNMKSETNQLVTNKRAEQKTIKHLPRDHYYKVLGVGKHANTQEIKLAYYALAKLFHPDANTSEGENKRFQEISDAYSILTDDSKRLEYDQIGLVKDEQDFLKKLMKLRSHTSSKKNVALQQTPDELKHMTNSKMSLEISFLEAAHGCKKIVNLSYLNKCPVCNGRAPKLATQNKQDICYKCEGTGKITKRTKTFTSVILCEACGGKRFIARHHCDNCDSRGMVVQQTNVTVIVPPGTRNDDVISLENPHTKQRVSYRITVQESDFFKRKGNDVYTDQYINISTAVLGGTIQVRGIYETLTLNVCAGTESHTAVRITGKGIKTREGCGDHVVNLKIRIPKELSVKQRQILQNLAKNENTTDD